MWKWIIGVLATVVAGILLKVSTNWLDLDNPPPANASGVTGNAGAAEGENTAANSDTTNDGEEPAPPPEPVIVMAPLEIGINRQGNDLDGYGKPAANAETCAELCRAEQRCDSMTYVKSTGVCWMKKGVPEASGHADMVSSVKKSIPAA